MTNRRGKTLRFGGDAEANERRGSAVVRVGGCFCCGEGGKEERARQKRAWRGEDTGESKRARRVKQVEDTYHGNEEEEEYYGNTEVEAYYGNEEEEKYYGEEEEKKDEEMTAVKEGVSGWRKDSGGVKSGWWEEGRRGVQHLRWGDEDEDAYHGNDEVKVKEGVTGIVDETVVDAEEDYYGNEEEEEAYCGTEEVEFYEEEEEYFGEEEGKKDEVVTAVRVGPLSATVGVTPDDWEEEDCIRDYSYWQVSDVKKKAKYYGNDEDEEYYGNEEGEEYYGNEEEEEHHGSEEGEVHYGSEEGEVHFGMEKRDEVVVKAVTAKNIDDVVEIVNGNAKNEKKVVEENNATKTVTTATETGKSSWMPRSLTKILKGVLDFF